jgi:glycosyltransferase involved in cell wall biosynthesis
MSFMAEPTHPRIICLSNVFDQHYHDLRGEKIDRTLGAKRPVLFQCLEQASGRELILLSVPPRAAERRTAKWLPAVETKFSTHRQSVCCNWDVPKLRVPLSWFFYARHVLRQVRNGDLVLIDNYEFVYVVAARLVNMFRKVTFILDYEDGKHLIDRSIWKFLSWLAEMAARPLLSGALLANPELGKRLPDALPTEMVPGFVPEQLPPWTPAPDGEVRFLYTGGLDRTRGVDLLLEAVKRLPEHGWHLDITGYGPLTEPVAHFAREPQWRGRVAYHHALPAEAYNDLLSRCHVGLNCQRLSDPISGVTFPSKVFTYLTAGLMVISSKASGVEAVCGNACLYYEEETPQSLAAVMQEVIEHFSAVRQKLDRTAICGRYSPAATTMRVRRLLKAMGV